MRLLVIFMTLLLFVGIVGFLITNVGTVVSVRVFTTEFPSVRLLNVVLISIFVGIFYVSVIAIAEGANIRLNNRKLKREVHRLETELNYLRTQPVGSPRAEPDALAPRRPEAEEPAGSGEAERIPSAPVYEAEGEGATSDPGDDAYSGGRAV
jgi:hypothetical protein